MANFEEILLTDEEFPFTHLIDPRIDMLSDNEIKEILNKIISKIVQFSYNHTPIVKMVMDNAGIKPGRITDIESFVAHFPYISAQTIKHCGAHMALPDIVAERELQRTPGENDLQVALKSTEKIGANETIRLYHTTADIRAATHALLRGIGRYPDIAGRPFIVNAEDEHILLIFEEAAKHFGSCFTRKSMAAGNQWKEGSIFVSLSTKSPLHVLWRQDKEAFKGVHTIIHTEQSEVINEIEMSGIRTIRIGTLTGTFIDIDGHPITFPYYAYLEQNGKSTTGRGRIILNKLLGVYEIENVWTQLMRDFELLLPSYHKNSLPDSNSQYYRESIGRINAFIKKINQNLGITQKNFLHYYHQARDTYLHKSLRVGIATGSTLLRHPLSLCTEMDDRRFTTLIEINNVQHSNESCTVAPEWMPIYGPLDHLASIPMAYHSVMIKGNGKHIKEPFFVQRMCQNIINGKRSDTSLRKNAYDCRRKSVLYHHRITDRKDFNNALKKAQDFAATPSCSLNLSDIHQILYVLYKKVRENSELYELFKAKSGIPEEQITEQLAAIPSLISIGSLQRILKEAHAQNIRNTPPVTPFCIVTPSNVNYYDGFLIFTHMLLSKLSDQQGGSSTIIMRPSASDIILTAIVSFFYDCIKEVPDYKEKGLHMFIQKIHWDPEVCPDYLPTMIKGSQGGLYFGKRLTYTDAIRAYADDESTHHIYGEGLNVACILRGPYTKDPSTIVTEILNKTYKLKSRDCTAIGTVLVSADVYDTFVNEFIKKTKHLNKTTNMGVYEKRVLYHTRRILKQYGGETHGNVYPEKHNTDLILNVQSSIPHDVTLLAMETPTPLLNIVKIDSFNELIDTTISVLSKAAVEKYSSIILYGSASEIKRAEHLIEQFSQIIKKNRCDFSPYEPHNERFFVRDFIDETRLNPIPKKKWIAPLLTSSLWYYLP
jgi:hypothetical protein